MKALWKRNLKELLRDPISILLCLAFPLIMLILMSILNNAIPPEVNMHLFELENLIPGICVFGLSFCMLFGALTVSRDRSGSFLWRLRASPLRPVDYGGGYFLPLLLVAAGQSMVCILAGQVVAMVGGIAMSFGGLMRCFLCLLPTMVLFVSLGIFLGGMLSEKAAPGLCSIVISAASLLSGIWMDVENIGGGFFKLCSLLPFYHCVKAGRMGYQATVGKELIISVLWALGALGAGILSLNWQLHRDA